MMIHEVTTGAERNKKTKRKGRGESSGHGKTSGRGNKGSGARTGTYIKRGFSNNNFERRYYIVNLQDVAAHFEDGATVDPVALKDKGLIPDFKLPVKILSQGGITKKLTILAGWYSKAAHQMVVDAGGTAQNVKGEVFAFPKPKKIFIPRDPVKKAKKIEEPAAEAEAKPVEAKPAAE